MSGNGIATITDNPEEHDQQIALYAMEEKRVLTNFRRSVKALRDEGDPETRRELARAVMANFDHYIKICQDQSVLLGGMNEVNEYLRAQIQNALQAVKEVKDLGYEGAKGDVFELVISNLLDFFGVERTAAYRFAKALVYGEAEGVLYDNLHVIGEVINVEFGGDGS